MFCIKGIIPGIKVDKGVVDLMGSEGPEHTTQGEYTYNNFVFWSYFVTISSENKTAVFIAQIMVVEKTK